MPTILETMRSNMREAMKAREAERLGTIRLLLASINGVEKDKGRELTDEEVTDILTTEAKKRREAAAAYRDGHRLELAEKEDGELEVILTYLPKQLTDEEVGAIVDEVIASTGASSKAEMGKVMGPVMARVKGRFDGSRVKDIVMAKLG